VKGQHHPANDQTLNPSRDNPSIRDVIDAVDPSRRRLLKAGAGGGALALFGGVALAGASSGAEAAAAIPAGPGFAGIGFASVPPNPRDAALGRLARDLVSVPDGYVAHVLAAWGDPVVSGAPAWLPDASQDAAAQALQIGMHHDGMHFFPINARSQGRPNVRVGLLCVNHEYTDEALLHTEGLTGGAGITIAKVRKSQAAHGVSVQHIGNEGGTWRVKRDSEFGRRITANTPMRIAGPAAGSPLLRSKTYLITPSASVPTDLVNDGFTAYGTLNNCANGYTPWGTYLSCEENWNGYFAAPTNGAQLPPEFADQKAEILAGRVRYGISTTGFGYGWHRVDPRFDADANPLEPNTFGWVVEIDPFDPTSTPVKRTALGRIKHESAQLVVDDADHVAFYMGDDERNEYIYKFVCARRLDRRPGETGRVANRDMLDHGTLYVARFAADGTGTWLPLVWGQGGLTPENGFRDQAEVLVKTRQAADRVGATMMDRPEWTAVRPRIGGFAEIEVYCTLTNNSQRGRLPPSSNSVNGTTGAATARPSVDAANPRPDNDYGHIIRWREAGRSVKATTFTWDLFVKCGDKLATPTSKPLPSGYDPAGHDGYTGNIVGDDYGAPDGLWFDAQGRLWIQTDQVGNGSGDWVNIGGNVMMCADPNSGATRRFLTSPTDCEVTGVTMTADGRTMFVNIQHPGDSGTPADPTATSHWPYSQGYGPAGRPRSATVVITKADGGVIGT
jgi:secreted PhoX family phosphatase